MLEQLGIRVSIWVSIYIYIPDEMEMIRGYFSKRWLFGPLQSCHHVKTHTHSMGLVSFRRIFLPAHRPVGFQRSFEALALSTLNDSIGNFLLSFFHRGALGLAFLREVFVSC